MTDPAYDLVIFDLDGTLIDSIGDIADALATTLGRELRDEDVARWVGSGVHELLRRAGAEGDLDEIARRYRAQYAKVPVRHTRPYLRVKESLRALTVDKAVATNKPGALARTIVDKLGLASEFALVLGEDDVGQKKPDPLIVDVIRGKLGRERARTLYVGDSLVDAATADAAGVDLCLVTYGYEDQARIAAAPAKFHIDRFEDVVGIVSGDDTGDAK
ncbi:MAG TPA: HAD-IA family hydrolase [Polyangia bacterium]|nr:HAD-IA family hydrolase [Polyangia bacterium]